MKKLLGICTFVVLFSIFGIQPAQATNSICDSTWRVIPPQGSGLSNPTGLGVGETTGGPEWSGIIVIRGLDNAVWMQTVSIGSPFPWSSSWKSLGGATNYQPRITTTTDSFGNVTTRIRVIGLDGNTWETHGQNGAPNGFRSWYLVATGNSYYYNTSIRTGWIAQYGVSFKVTGYLGVPVYNCQL